MLLSRMSGSAGGEKAPSQSCSFSPERIISQLWRSSSPFRLFLRDVHVFKAAGRTPPAMGRKTGEVLLLFFPRTIAQMFSIVTYCALQEIELLSASWTSFQFCTSLPFLFISYLCKTIAPMTAKKHAGWKRLLFENMSCP
jgi:hypothetical protein